MPPRPPPPATARRIGCFRDQRRARVFPNKAWVPNLTLQRCLSFAANPPATYRDQKVPRVRRAVYFATQFG